MNDVEASITPIDFSLSRVHARLDEVATALPPTDIVLWSELRRAAVGYFQKRAHWRLAPAEERPTLEQGRTSAHDVFIDSCNALSRRCGVYGLDQQWRIDLGDARTLEGRKRIGDYACYLAYRLTLEAR